MQVLEEWLLTHACAAVHLPTATAVVADLHLGYGQARRRGGEAVPGRPVAVELAALARVLARPEVRRLAVAGDLFEEGRRTAGELIEEFLDWIDEVGVELLGVVPGNHDRGLVGTRLPLCPTGIELGRWRVVHGHGDRPSGAVVQGHEHPCLRWRGAAGPCYLVAPDHLILPACSADAAGGNVLGRREWEKYQCCAIAGEKVLDFGTVGELLQRLRQ